MAGLAQLPNKHVHPLFDSVCGISRELSAPNSIWVFTVNRSRKGRFMKKKSRIEMARDIVSYVRKEMDRPRLTESVRDGLSATAAPATEKPATISARA